MTDRHSIHPYPIRMPIELRVQLEEWAKNGNRSLHAEIIARLERSLEPTSGLPESVTSAISDACEEWNVSFEDALERAVLAGVNKDAPQVIVIRAKGGMTVAEMKALFEAAKECTSPDATVYLEK